uniref:hypothetical protein n=1 Tax=Gelidibacter sp. TaxID=2018083 RepID=UPI00404B792E
MKPLFILIFLTTSISLFAQDDIKTSGVFYKISLAATLTTNEYYTIGNDEGETFINLNAIFVNNTIGYQFDDKTSIGLNLEYNYYDRQYLNFFPAYLNFTYNILDFDDKVFVRGGYGRLLDLGKAFETGTMYTFGAGGRFYDENYKNSWLIGVDFSRKRFGYKQDEKLTSVSIFIEFMLF